MKKPTAFGVFCGIGSMLIGAKKSGFKVIGNFETRKGMSTGTFEHNFKAPFYSEEPFRMEPEYITGFLDISLPPDLIMGHPPCGNFSNLTSSAHGKKVKDPKAKRANPGMIPEFINWIELLKPKYFVMENLQKSTVAYPIEKWKKKFENKYDLFFEIVHNGDYGNAQKFKKRFFVIGALKNEKFKFLQIKNPLTQKTVRDVIGDLPFYKDISEINHTHVKPNDIHPIYWNGPKKTYKETAKLLLSMPTGKSPTYINKEGIEKLKIGMSRLDWDRPSRTMTAGSFRRTFYKFHPETGYPLTVREILRIQGAPDDFILKAPELSPEQVIQSGKFIAVEFCHYVASKIMKNIKRRK